MILTNARLLTFDEQNRVFDSGTVEVLPDGTIGAVGPETVVSGSDDEVFDAGGRLLMPALINCHTHLYSTLARGIAVPGSPAENFPQILQKLWWPLDRALNYEDIYYSALVGLIDSAKCGVGTILDHHSSPNACAGSLDILAQAFREVGLRGALCYETSDRNGPNDAIAGIDENVRFIERTRQSGADSRIRATFGLHAAFTLGDRTLSRCAEAGLALATGFHIHVAEDACDAVAVPRLERFGLLGSGTLAAHCLHISSEDIATLAAHQVNVIHNPQSNCNNAVGLARVVELVRGGVRVGLGSDGYSPRLWEEFKTALHLQKLCARDPRVGYGEIFAAAFSNNREILRTNWGVEIGKIQTGARADLMLLDYYPPTPLHAENLFGHLMFGISNSPVDSLLVDGRYVVRNKQCVTVDERAIAEKAAIQARDLWRRFENSCKT